MIRYSIIHDLNDKTCFVCGSMRDIHTHEVFYGTANRQLSIKYGLCVCLCAFHHNASNNGVHHNRVLDLKLKKHAQKIAMEHYSWATEDFIKIFGKNYL